GDTAMVSRLIDQLVTARRRMFKEEDPIAVIYAGYIWAWADSSVGAGLPEWVWEPIRRDALGVLRAHLSPTNTSLGNALFNLARSIIARGDYEEGERLASESLAIQR